MIGLPGAGKSTVARLVARELAAPLVDIDARIVERTGKSVSAIFADEGEPAFRTLEREEMGRALAAEPAVVDPGGGWVAQPGALENAGNRALLIYLETDPGVAARRVAAEGGRPLLTGDVTERMVALLEARERAYSQAQAHVRTDLRTADEVAFEVVRLARSRGGW